MSTPMTQKLHAVIRFAPTTTLVLTALLLIAVAMPAIADPDEDEVLRRDSGNTEPVPAFARVRFIDGDASALRNDGTSDDLAANMPIYSGDRVDSQAGGRVEMQLPDGSMVRLDSGTKIELYDLLDPSFRNPSPTLLGISSGVLQVDIDDARDGDALRIDTPAASIYVLERGSFRIDIDRSDVVRISVERGRVEVAGERDSVIVASGQRASVRPGGRPGAAWRYNVYATDSFDRWVSDRDDLYDVRVARGREYDELPSEVRPYYSELSRNGRWVYADDWGWVWRPSVDDDWRPYTSGYWSSGPWGPVWVGAESWGWCTSRYGRWDFRRGAGWVWIPGRVFSPAHVYWYYGPEYVGWCPLGWWDRPVHLSISFGWGHNWFNDCPWWFVGYDHFYYGDVRRHQPPRGAVTADLRRGVVSRHAVVKGRDAQIGRGGVDGKRRVAIPREALDRSAFDRAKSVAVRRGDDAKLVSGVGERDDVRERPKAGFRERERSEIEQRARVHGGVRARGTDNNSEAGAGRDGGSTAKPGRPGVVVPRGERRPSNPSRGDRTERDNQTTDDVAPRVPPRATPHSVPRRSEPRERVAPRGDGGSGERAPTRREAPRAGDDDGSSTVRDFLGRVGRGSDSEARPRRGQAEDEQNVARDNQAGTEDETREGNDASRDRQQARPRDENSDSPPPRDSGQAKPRDTSRDKSAPRSGSGTSGSRSGGSKSSGSDNKPKPRGGGGGGSHRH